jgi:hypothetical protein
MPSQQLRAFAHAFLVERGYVPGHQLCAAVDMMVRELQQDPHKYLGFVVCGPQGSQTSVAAQG